MCSELEPTQSGNTNTEVPPIVPAPVVFSVSPAPGSFDVPIDDFIEMEFSKEMDPSSFFRGLRGFIDSSRQFVCVNNDCKVIRVLSDKFLEYETNYDLTLESGVSGVRDIDGETLASPVSWSFSTNPVTTFKPDLGFVRVTLDGGGLIDSNQGSKVIDDAGECTSVHVDSSGTVHLTYLSVSDWSPKHAFCVSNCTEPGNWTKELIDSPSSATPSRGLGRDVNMDIDLTNDQLHVSYRDYCIACSGATLKYATKLSGVWGAVVVDTTSHSITDTYIKIDVNKRIHITYRSSNSVTNPENVSEMVVMEGLAYATCDPIMSDCLLSDNWKKVLVEGGWKTGENSFAAPNHLFLTDDAIHVSYYANGALKYAKCLLALDCSLAVSWETVAVHIPPPLNDVGTENSIFVDSSGVHITYRDNTNADLRYASCASDCSAMDAVWSTIIIDSLGRMGGSSQLKIDGSGAHHVVYGDRSNWDLKYAYCPASCLDTTAWSLYRIDAPGNLAEDNYVALSADGKVHISYRDITNKALKYAVGNPPI